MNQIELAKIKEEALQEHIPILMDDTLEILEQLLQEKASTNQCKKGRGRR